MPKQTQKNRLLHSCLALLSLAILVFVGVITIISGPVTAATNSTINFQARLLTSGGATVPDGNYNVEFKIYNTLTSSGSSQGSCSGDAACQWAETRTSSNRVRVVNGYLTVDLGSVTAFGGSIRWDQDLYLGMNIGGTAGSPTWDGEMTPRLHLTSVPYAFRAGQLVTTNGANTSTLGFVAPTANRTINLPDESGTLCIQSSSSCGFALSSGSGNYIQNGTTVQAANFAIQSSAAGSASSALIKLATGQTGNLLQLQDASSNILGGFNNSGRLYYTNSGFTGLIDIGTLTGNQTYTLPNSSGTFCLTSGNCAGVGGTGDILNNGQNGPITIGTNDNTTLTLETNNTPRITIQGGGNVSIGSNFTVDGSTGNVTSGTLNGQTISSAASFTGTVAVNTLGSAGSTALCRNGSNQLATCNANPSSITLQQAYGAGNTIATTDARNIDFTLADTTTDANFSVSVATGSTGFVSLARADGAGAADPAQLLLLDNLDTNRAQPIGLKIQSAAGGMTTALDLSDAEIGTAINIGANDIQSNGLTISSAELNLLDGHDVALIDTNDAVNTAITGTGALNSGSITTGFGAIDTGADNISTTGTVNAGVLSVSGNATLSGTLAVTAATTLSGDLAANGNTTIGNATTDRLTVTAQLLGATPLVFQGGTDNAFTTTLAITDPTANRTVTFGDETGTVCMRTATSCGFAASTGSTNYIQNQSASDQSADFRISGTGRANTSLLTPLLDTATGVALNVGGTATAINLNENTAVTGTLGATGNINTSGGVIQTNSTTRIDNTGNLTNIGNLTGTGAITIASSGAGNDVTINGADQFIVQDAAVFNDTATFNGSVNLALGGAENFNITNTLTGTLAGNLSEAILTNNTTSGTQQVQLLQNAAGSGITEALLSLDNADTDTAVGSGIVITSAAGGITTALNVADSDIGTALSFGANDIDGTNFDVDGATGNVTAATYNGQTISSAANFTGTLSVTSLGAAGSTAVCRNGSNQLATCSANPNSVTLQQAYDAGNTITSTNARNLSIALADTATDSNFFIDLQCDTACGGNGRFAVQDDGADVFTISPAGGAAVFQNSVDSGAAFQVLNAADDNILTVDTVDADYALIEIGGSATGPDGSQIRLWNQGSQYWSLATDDTDHGGANAFSISNSNLNSTVFALRGSDGGAIFRNDANSTTGFQIQKADDTPVLSVDTAASQVKVRAGNDTATLGSEMITSNNFSTSWTGTGWTRGASSATHTSGTTGLSPATPLSVNATTVYQVIFTVTGVTAGNVTPSIGGSSGTPAHGAGTQTQTIVSVNTNNLAFNPTTDFNGTISAVSVKPITLAFAPLILRDSSGTDSAYFRTGTAASSNIFIGGSSGGSNIPNAGDSSGYANTALGVQAMQGNITGKYNTAVGNLALQANTTGTDNTANGRNALTNNTIGDKNTAHGAAALVNSNSGSNNTALGYFSLGAITSGSNNTAVGYNAGNSDTDGFYTYGGLQNATALGTNAQAQADDVLILGGAGSDAVNVGIGTTRPDNVFSVSPVQYSTGTVSQSGTTVTGSGTTFTSAMVGGKIIFLGGATATITGFTNATTLTVTPSQTLPSQNYRIHYQGFQVTSAGQVGIGIPTPSNALHVDQGTAAASFLQFTAGTTTGQTNVDGLTVGIDNNGASYIAGWENQPMFLATNSTSRIKIAETGNVGIGGALTTGQELEVNGDIRLDMNGTGTGFALCHSSAATANQDIVDCTSTPAADYMEMYPVNSGAAKGDLVALGSKNVTTKDGDRIKQLVKTSASYQSNVIGVVSDKSKAGDFNSIGHNISQKDNPMPVALNGRVPVKVSAENGAIAPGDPLTTSSKPGVAMKATQPGMVIGRALGSHSKASVGQVMVFINNYFYTPPAGGTQGGTQNNIQNGGNANLATLNVSGHTTLNTLTVTGDATFQGQVTVKQLTIQQELRVNGHLISGGDTPTITGASGGQAHIEGTDTAGTVTITPAGPDPGELAEITFSKPYASKPRITISGVNAAGAKLQVYMEKTATGFKLRSDMPLNPGAEYQYDYIVVQ